MALRTFKRSAPRWPWSRRLRRTILILLAAVGLAVTVGACSSSSPTSSASTGSASGKVGGSMTVWVDSVRLPAAQAYAKAHPNVQVHIVTFDGDGNGATTLQAKIQLWNRTGNGWPDVIFSEQVNDPVWMAQKPFDFAAPISRPHPGRACSASGPRRRPPSARSTARSTASRTTSPRSCSGSTRS